MADRFANQFVTFMRMTPPQRRVAWWRGRVLQWMGVALSWFWLGLVLYLLRPVAFSSALEPYSFYTPNLANAAWNVVMVLLPAVATIVFTAITQPSKICWYGSNIVRMAALAGKNKLAVGAIDQPEPLAGDEIPQDAASFSALRLYAFERAMIVVAGADALLMVAMTVFVVVMWQSTTTNSANLPKDGLDLGMYILPLVGTGRLFALYGMPYITPNGWWIFLPGRRKKLLAVDGWGIRWSERRWRTHEYTLAWQDIASFCVYRHYSGFSVTYTYVLLGNDVSFAWMVPARAKEAQRAASELLARLVITHTGRPLLDLTASIDAAESLDFPFARSSKFGVGGREPALTLRAELAAYEHGAQRAEPGAYSDLTGLSGAPLRPVQLKKRVYWINGVLLVALAVGFVGALMVDQQRSDDYYRTIYPRIITVTPVYSDPLTSANNAWPVQTPTQVDPANLAYANGGYTINGGPGQNSYNLWRGAQYADLAVAVTVRELAAPDYGPIGLVARVQGHGSGDVEQIVFEIDPTEGDWELFHYQPGQGLPDDGWHSLGGSDDTAIHPGIGATNRLLLVVIGQYYLCYVNGQFVGGVKDAYHDASPPHPGYAGLYVSAPSTVAVFNDFAIYPVPPPHQPLFPGL